jgi:hypothetical protein
MRRHSAGTCGRALLGLQTSHNRVNSQLRDGGSAGIAREDATDGGVADSSRSIQLRPSRTDRTLIVWASSSSNSSPRVVASPESETRRRTRGGGPKEVLVPNSGWRSG